MRIYGQKDYKLLMMNPGLKGITSIFLAFVLAGYLCGLVMGIAKSGCAYESIVIYYRGNGEMGFYPKSFMELLEVTHFHLFSIPVVLLIVGHLVMMTYASLRTRILLILASLAGMTADLASPWMVRYVAPAFAWMKILGMATFGVSFILMILLCFFEMYFRKNPYELTDVV